MNELTTIDRLLIILVSTISLHPSPHCWLLRSSLWSVVVWVDWLLTTVWGTASSDDQVVLDSHVGSVIELSEQGIAMYGLCMIV